MATTVLVPAAARVAVAQVDLATPVVQIVIQLQLIVVFTEKTLLTGLVALDSCAARVKVQVAQVDPVVEPQARVK
jgi:hypothetical protein